MVLKTDERRSGSIDGKAHRVHHLQQGGADDVVTELLIAALTASARSQMQRSGSGFDASRSAIARVDSKCG